MKAVLEWIGKGDQLVTEWRPGEHLRKVSNGNPLPAAALLILNQPINDIPGFRRLWEHCEYRICADGGANQLYELFEAVQDSQDSRIQRDAYLPNEIHGDLDSLRPEVELYYKDKGVQVTRDPDQYSTDFTKCLKRIRTVMMARGGPQHQQQRQGETRNFRILVFGGLGGRVDQALSTIHHLYVLSKESDGGELTGADKSGEGKILLYSDESISFVLPKGRNIIYTPLADGILEENVGILPIGTPAVITTKGLEWDVEGWKTEFGDQVSTSNYIRSDIVRVETSERVLFTVERSKRLP
ncbi:MAG: hypothetical protein M1837_002271 [Sclerophora amabilis]|nr:MAG: hypothetical protein M1837_002271 [Sclerophora amabilis]